MLREVRSRVDTVRTPRKMEDCSDWERVRDVSEVRTGK